jgi:hypothetical protein
VNEDTMTKLIETMGTLTGKMERVINQMDKQDKRITAVERIQWGIIGATILVQYITRG